MPCRHADCPLPPPLSSVPPRLSGPSLPSPPFMLKSFEAHMWADSAYFSTRRRSFYGLQVLHRRRTEASRGRYESQHLGEADETRSSRELPILSRFIVVSSEFVCVSCVSEGGFTGLCPPAKQARHFARWISGEQMSWLLA